MVFASVLALTLAPDSTTTALPEKLSRPVYLIANASQAEYFPFLFDLADGPPEWKKGVALSKQQLVDLKKLASTLKACVGHQPNQDVIVEIFGFADTND